MENRSAVVKGLGRKSLSLGEAQGVLLGGGISVYGIVLVYT